MMNICFFYCVISYLLIFKVQQLTVSFLIFVSFIIYNMKAVRELLYEKKDDSESF